MAKYLIYLLVTVAGAAVLAIELLGTRVLGPFSRSHPRRICFPIIAVFCGILLQAL